MKNAKNTRLHVWELALLLALAAAILWGAASLSRQEDLGRKVIRLHVIANSDSPEDQALKLRVRDRVLARAQELLEQSADMAQAREVLTSALPELTREAQQVLAAAGCGDGVRARLEPAEFPTRRQICARLPFFNASTILSESGRPEMEISSSFRYMAAVELATGGFTITNQHIGSAGRTVSRSPRPWARAVPPRMQ